MKEIKKEAKAQAKESKKPGAVRGIVLFLLFVILSAGGVAAGYFGYIYYTDHIRQDTNDAGLYLWEGEYVDTVGYQTTMSIEKGDRKSFYKVTICMGEENSG
ncbi:MAG: hypothetical protein IJT32_06630, partial [Lachnospiraceae bacterium]|nr:hypothetical protein [Lachnospiraceae bacterium]